MAEYKDCEALSKNFREKFEYYKAKSEIKVCDGYMYDEKMQYAAIVAKHFLDELKRIPTADVVEVVFCERCKDYEPHGNGKAGVCRNKKCTGLRYATDYCSYGERRCE